MARPPRGPMWKNRIVAHGHEAPDQLLANPANGYKIHPEAQQDEVEKVIETVGWVRPVLVNRRTGHVVDGHLRVQLALRRNEETVPVDYVDISQAEERLLLVALDPTAGMIARDEEKLAELLNDVTQDFPASDIDWDVIFGKEPTKTKGLRHQVKRCTCCEKKCKPGCGCHREE